MSDKSVGPHADVDLSGIRTRHDFARALTLIRERAGLTVRDVAKRMDMPAATVGGYFAGRHLPSVKPPTLLDDLLLACGVTDAAIVEQWRRVLLRVRRAPGRRPAGAPVPYRGLESFQPEHAEWFFGRETLTDLLIKRMGGLFETGGLLVVVGPSGSGKSSLLRAGLVPALHRGAVGRTGLDTSPVLLMTPGAHPVQELAAQLAGISDVEVSQAVEALTSDPGSIIALTRQVMSAADAAAPEGGDSDSIARRLVMVVDQFEEVLAADSGQEARIFVDALCAVSKPASCCSGDVSTDEPVRSAAAALVVLGLRADFYDQALRYPQLAPALQESQVVVGPMTEAELRRAIVEPAHRANVDIEDGLVELLLRDVAPASSTSPLHGIGALPLLSHALRETWERGHRRRLTVHDYQEAGRIEGAVSRSAENVYAALTTRQQALARQILLRLVHIADDAADTRRRASRSELPLNDTDAQVVLDQFIEHRLLTVDFEEVEISHEALLVAWPRLRDWIDLDRTGLRTHRQLTQAVQAWRDSGRDPQALYRGVRLAVVRDWLADPGHAADLNDLERQFIDASIQREMIEAAAARRRTRRLQQLLATLTVLVLVAAGLTVYAFQQRSIADQQRDLAISRQVATVAKQLRTTDVALAMQLSLAAYQIAPTPEARSSLLESFAGPAVTRALGPTGVTQTVAVTNDGRTMAAGGADFAIRLWDLTNPGQPTLRGSPLTGHTDTIYSAAFSPDGRTLATGSGDRIVRLWNTSEPARATPIATLTAHDNTVYTVAISPDGTTLATGSADKTIRLWDLAIPDAPKPIGQAITGSEGYVQSVAFHPTNAILAAGGTDNTVRLWDITNPATPIPMGSPLTGATRTVFAVAFSPDGRTLAAASADKTIQLWALNHDNVPTPEQPPLTGPSGWINSIAFSADSGYLAAGSSDNQIWIWDTATRRTTSTLPHPAPVTTVTYIPNSHRLISSAADGTVRLWDPPGPIITGPNDSIFNTSFSNHNIIAIASNDNTVSLWDVTEPRRPQQIGPTIYDAGRLARGTGAASLSPDARTLAIGTADGSVQLWDVTNPAQPTPLPTRLIGHTAAVQAVTFSPDGHILVITSSDKTASLWDLRNASKPAQLGKPLTGPTNYAYGSAFSPDGRLLAIGSADKTVYLWDITDPIQPRSLGAPLTGPDSYVFTVAFSRDGQILAVGSADKTIRLWNVSNPEQPTPIGAPLTGPDNYINAIAFSPDNHILAAGAGDGTVWLWTITNPNQPQPLATLNAHGRATNVVEYDPNRNILVTGSTDKTARLWNTNPDAIAAYICSITGNAITTTEWNKHIQGRPYQPPCP